MSQVKIKSNLKASLFETESPNCILLNEGFLNRRFPKKCRVAKRLFIKHLLDFAILDCIMTRKGVKDQEKSPRDDNLIRQIALRSPNSSCKKIRTALLLKGTYVHRKTLSRRLVYDSILKAHKPAKNFT